ncbi:PKD domain-containing protein [Acidobacteriota bacterium]
MGGSTGIYEPLLESGLLASVECFRIDTDDYQSHLRVIRQAIYIDNGTSPIIVTGAEGSKWDNRWGFPLPVAFSSAADLGWPYKIVKIDGSNPDPSHSPIPMRVKYAISKSGSGWSAAGGSIVVRGDDDNYYSGHLAHFDLDWHFFCDGTISSIAYSNLTGGVTEPVPLIGIFDFEFADGWYLNYDNPYLWLKMSSGGGGYMNSPSASENNKWKNGCYIPPYGSTSTISQASLSIDPNWEHANEYKIITLKDFDAPVEDPASWVPLVDVNLDMDSTVYGMGSNSNGQLSQGGTGGLDIYPRQVLDPSDPSGFMSEVKSVAAGFNHSLALKNDGTVFAWGDNNAYQLGVDPPPDQSSVPIQVEDANDPSGYLTNVKAISAHTSSLALKHDGTIWAWGSFSHFDDAGNALGLEDIIRVDDLRPPSENITDVIAIDMSGCKDNFWILAGNHNMALRADGTVLTWGRNWYGQLGNGNPSGSMYDFDYNPKAVIGLDNVMAIEAGDGHSLALKSDGTVWAWGRNHVGQLGIGVVDDSAHDLPVQVVGPGGIGTFLTDIIAISTREWINLALDSGGTVWQWGGSSDEPAPIEHSVPYQVLTDVNLIETGKDTAFARKSDGSLWGWGSNSDGQLGLNYTAVWVATPTQVVDTDDPTGFIKNVNSVSGGDGFSLIVKNIPRPSYAEEGTDVVVVPTDSTTGDTPVTLTFQEIVEPGSTQLITSEVGPVDPAGFMLGDPATYYLITTNALHTGGIEICIDYSNVEYVEISSLRLYHYEDDQWVDITTSHDIVSQIICGISDSLSPFGIFETSPNTAPTADAGPDQTDVPVGENCSTDVTLDGSSSSDNEGNTLTYSWTWSDGSAEGESPTIQLAPGTHVITLIVNDGTVDSDPASVEITVIDNLPPEPLVTKQECEQVGNGKGNMANKITVGGWDNCSEAAVSVTIDKVEVFNNGGKLVKGNGIYKISGNILYVYPSGNGWSVIITATATDEEGNSQQLVLDLVPLVKCKK